MVISQTPFRVSFFGGGTDYPAWYQEHGGAVLGTTIDKYCYIAVRRRPPYFDDNYRVVYSREDCVKCVDEITHPTVREAIKYLGIDYGLEIIHWSDLPARKGLGASSAFAVGLLKALWTMMGKAHTSWTLAVATIHLEQDWVGDNVGCQDQWHAAQGGFQHIQFLPQNGVVFETIDSGDLENHLMLFDTGTSRIASQIVANFEIPKKKRELQRMQQMVDDAIDILKARDYADFGKLLNEAWWFKKRLSSQISTPVIDAIYEKALKAGAWGGKLIGAGGGGFMVFVAKPELHDYIKEILGLKCVPFKFEREGSRIIYDGLSSSKP